VFHRFRQEKFADGGLILSSSRFLLLHQLPQKMKFAEEIVRIDPKTIISPTNCETHYRNFERKENSKTINKTGYTVPAA
jgi:hypothetical protein